MAHGDMDQVVACKWGEESCEKLKNCGLDVQFKTYSGLGHSANDSEISDVASFLKSRIS
jgi:predicted esterase